MKAVSHLTTRARRRVERGFPLKGSCLLWAAWLAGCASTPTPLSLPTLAIDDPAFGSSLEAFAGAPIIGDNRVEILLNGEQTFPSLLDAIRSSESTITFEAYIFHEGKVADELVEALAERCRAKVRVTMLLDAQRQMGCQNATSARSRRPAVRSSQTSAR
jgi:phosphatidylserine/phosphatidylglycerophosphate/cardiolipin synthase-like enzyme